MTDDRVCSKATVAALELPAVLAMLARLAATEGGRQRILELTPTRGPVELRKRGQLNREISQVLDSGPLVPSVESSFGDLASRLRSSLSSSSRGEDLVALASLVEAARGAVRRLIEENERAPELSRRAAMLDAAARQEDGHTIDQLLEQIRRVLDPRGEVRDDASPQLRRLRSKAKRCRDDLYKNLGSYVDRHRESLSDETISQRGGRLTVLLPAGSRGRLQGLVHSRSATGKSFYFEPLEVVEGNNDLARALEEDALERERLLAAVYQQALEVLSEVETWMDFLAELDALQAGARFAALTNAELPDWTNAELVLEGAVHPLLDSRLASLRQEALGHPGHRGAVEPLDIVLKDRRVLVITGPNAGGKTVALKTVGLLTLLAQCGLPVPAKVCQLPVFRHVVAVVGDEQDVLCELSTFSARLSRLAECWQSASPEALILLDEMGSGTSPEEGAALAIAILEGLLEQGAWALLTTHLTELARAALEAPSADCAAMEFDRDKHQPTYRLRPGPPAGSEALSLARRMGLPTRWLERAEQVLGTEHRDFRQALAEVEGHRQALEAERRVQARLLADQEQLLERLKRQGAELEEERRRLRVECEQTKAELQRQMGRRFEEELERLRSDLRPRRRQEVARRSARRLAEALEIEVRDGVTSPETLAPQELRVGDTVRHSSLGWRGEVERIDRQSIQVRVSGKRVQCRVGDVRKELSPMKEPKTKRKSALTLPDQPQVSFEINLVGLRVEPALAELDSYLDRAYRSNAPKVRVIHGFGSGRLRRALRQHLHQHPVVAGHAPGDLSEGGDGATIVRLKGS